MGPEPSSVYGSSQWLDYDPNAGGIVHKRERSRKNRGRNKAIAKVVKLRTP